MSWLSCLSLEKGLIKHRRRELNPGGTRLKLDGVIDEKPVIKHLRSKTRHNRGAQYDTAFKIASKDSVNIP